MGHGAGLGQPQIDGDAPAAIFFHSEPAPGNHAAAIRAKIETQRLATGVRPRLTGHVNALAHIVVDPQRAISAAHAAVAGGDGLGHSIEPPLHGAAMATALEHVSTRRRPRRWRARTIVSARQWTPRCR